MCSQMCMSVGGGEERRAREGMRGRRRRGCCCRGNRGGAGGWAGRRQGGRGAAPAASKRPQPSRLPPRLRSTEAASLLPRPAQARARRVCCARAAARAAAAAAVLCCAGLAWPGVDPACHACLAQPHARRLPELAGPRLAACLPAPAGGWPGWPGCWRLTAACRRRRLGWAAHTGTPPSELCGLRTRSRWAGPQHWAPLQAAEAGAAEAGAGGGWGGWGWGWEAGRRQGDVGRAGWARGGGMWAPCGCAPGAACIVPQNTACRNHPAATPQPGRQAGRQAGSGMHACMQAGAARRRPAPELLLERHSHSSGSSRAADGTRESVVYST